MKKRLIDYLRILSTSNLSLALMLIPMPILMDVDVSFSMAITKIWAILLGTLLSTRIIFKINNQNENTRN